ncbi:MAG: ComEC/Rec2 family competence protein [Patescibacteria group bacterium]|jgi:competence protein ComEC
MAKLWRSKARLFLFINLTFIALVFLFGFRSGAYRPKITAADLASYNNHYLTITARVCEEADMDYKSRRLTVCICGKISGQALITTNLYPEYDYGDFIKISGDLEAPPKIDGFDYESYLARYDIYSVMYYPKIELIKGTLTRPQQAYLGLMKLKKGIKEIINANLTEPEAGLANALLLGYRRTVSREDLKIFSRVGLSHMIAISGSHITILSAMIINFFLALGFRRRRALLIIFGFLVLYPLVTGLAASAVRSAIMGGLAFLAVYHQRSSSLINALVFSGALMLAFNPRLLRDDIGFQLSFVALLGIIYIYPLGERITSRFLNKLKLKHRLKSILKTVLDTVNLTLVSQVVILPIALVNFKQLSLIAPLANVLVLWTFPPLLASLIIGTFLSALIPALGVLWFLPAYLLLKFIFIISKLLAEPSWAAMNVNNFNWYFGAGYYLFLAGLIWFSRKQKTIA